MTAKFVIRLALFAAMVLGCSMMGTIAPPSATTAPIPPTSQSTGKHIQFQGGATSTTVSGQLAAHATDQWVVTAQAGQTLSAKLNGQATLVVTDRNGKPLLDGSARATTFSTVLASTQDYQISVVGGDQPSTNYTLTVTLENASKPTIQRIQFQAGATSATVTGQVAPNTADYWVVSVKAGHTISANLTASGEAGLTMSGADGSLPHQDSPTSFKDVVSTGQDYNINVVGNYTTTTAYSLTVEIK